MTDQPQPTQATVPNQSAAEVQQTQFEKQHHAGGNAMLDAEIEAGEMSENQPNIEYPSATNFNPTTEKTG